MPPTPPSVLDEAPWPVRRRPIVSRPAPPEREARSRLSRSFSSGNRRCRPVTLHRASCRIDVPAVPTTTCVMTGPAFLTRAAGGETAAARSGQHGIWEAGLCDSRGMSIVSIRPRRLDAGAKGDARRGRGEWRRPRGRWSELQPGSAPRRPPRVPPPAGPRLARVRIRRASSRRARRRRRPPLVERAQRGNGPRAFPSS